VNLTSANTRFERLRASDQYISFSGDLTTSAGSQIAWTVGGSDKFQLKGWHIVSLVTTALNGTGAGIISLFDNTSLVAPLFGFEKNAPEAVQFESKRDLGEGFLSSTDGHDLIIKPEHTNLLGAAGVLHVAGLVWGELR
jgi:hypothetical protein